MRIAVVYPRRNESPIMKFLVWMICATFCPVAHIAAAAALESPIPGRLFYTPAQRIMLNNARLHHVTDLPKAAAPNSTPQVSAPVSFDGVITRSDGVATHWINGRPQVGRYSDKVRNLKPGQTRATQKVYESYQIRQPESARSPTASPTLVKPAKPETSTP